MQLPTSEKTRIYDWEIDAQPREKLLRKGPDALCNAELLAILLNTGTPGNNAVDMARDILDKAKNNLLLLGSLKVKDLTGIKGMGRAKAAVIAAAIELGKRRTEAEILERPLIRHGGDAAKYIRLKLRDKKQEVFAAIYLNAAGRVLNFVPLSEGGMTSTTADPKVIFRKALEENAINIILGHNHPSGYLRPSQADKEITQKVKEGAKLMDMKLLDHIIVTETAYFSFSDEGLL